MEKVQYLVSNGHTNRKVQVPQMCTGVVLEWM